MPTSQQKPDKELLDRIAEAAASKTAIDDTLVRDLLKEIVESLEGDVTKHDLIVFNKLQKLSEYIQNARAELAGISQSVNPDEIMTATDELEAVVAMTEDAANRILDAAEQIEIVAGKLDESHADALRAATTKIYEASNFQDVTGQRIRKVVRILQHLEEGINNIMQTFGFDTGLPAKTAKTASIDDRASLMNGPQLPENANDQDAIDALFDSIDIDDPKS